MPTISQMMRGTYQMYRYAQKHGDMFKSYNNTVNSSSSTMSGLLGIRSNVSDLIKNYNSTKNIFNTELNDTLGDLKKSVNKIKTLDFNVNTDDEVAGEKTSEIVDTIKDFADKYNDTITFFSDNSSISKYVKNIASTFSDTTYNSDSAANIGIKIDSAGKMSVNEEKLSQIITNNPTRVEAVMSTLTNKADRHISFAKSQQSRMFPSMQTMLGSSIKSASVYSGNSLMRISNYSNIGSLFNYFA